MPQAKSWVEEMVSEYLILKGYFVLTDVGIGAARRGGRYDIDIVAINPKSNEIRIVDIRGMHQGTPNKIASQSLNTLNRAENKMRSKYGNNYTYVKELVLVGKDGPKVKDVETRLHGAGITVKSLDNIIREIMHYIDKWRQYQKKAGLVKQNTNPSLPDTLYLLKLLEFIKDNFQFTF